MLGHSLSGNLPTRNFRDGGFLPVEKISAETVCQAWRVGMDSCFACPIRCKKVIELDEPWPVNPTYGGPGYETLAAFGSNCYIDDPRAIAKAHELCNRYGMDTISCGCTVAFAMECFEKGLITSEDTGGLELSFGNAPAMVEMVKRIAHRQGLGDLLAEGSRIAVRRIGHGAKQYAIHVKGLEVPMHDPRLKKALGLHYSVHATGADHCTGVHDTLFAEVGDELAKVEPLGIFEPIHSTELSPRKVRLAHYLGLWRHLNNHLGLCLFLPYSLIQKRDAVAAITGLYFSAPQVPARTSSKACGASHPPAVPMTRGTMPLALRASHTAQNSSQVVGGVRPASAKMDLSYQRMLERWMLTGTPSNAPCT